jgi:hypothetical protein
MAIDYGLTVDKKGFNASMEEARQKARNARNKVIFTFLLSVEANPESIVVPFVIPLFLLFVFLYLLITFSNIYMLLVLKSVMFVLCFLSLNFMVTVFTPSIFIIYVSFCSLEGTLLLWMRMLQRSCANWGLPARTIAQSFCGPRLVM